MANRGRLILFSGPSGVGKDTLLEILLKKNPDLQHSVSVTTRAKRENEIDGKDYHFISLKDFKRMQKNGEILEFNEYNGHFYATPKKPIDNWLKRGKDVILKIDVHGTENIERLYEDRCLSIFILPPSIEILEKRLRKRGTESEEDLKGRMRIALDEIEKSREYDYQIVNDELEKAADEILAILYK